MSTPSSWPPPPQQGAPQPSAPAPGPYPPQGRFAPQPVPYGQQGQYPPQGHYPPQPYGQQLPVGYQPPPRPERPLMPGVWWSLVFNLVVTVGFAVLVLIVGWAMVELISSAVGEPVSWQDAAEEEGVSRVVLIVGIALVASLLVSWGLTVVALLLWRLVRGFRTLPPAVQALLAYITMWVATSVLSAVAQVAFGVFGAAAGSGSGS